MDRFTLNKEKPEIEFELSSEESYLLLKNVCVKAGSDFSNQWVNVISNVKLIAELRYVVFTDSEGRFIDERKKQFAIQICPDLQQVQPIIQLNEFIKNETFTLGMNPERKFYQTLKLELLDIECLDDDYALEFNVELFKIGD